MPLPDERPRASVANLIGKFEQQNKRIESQNKRNSLTLPDKKVPVTFPASYSFSPVQAHGTGTSSILSQSTGASLQSQATGPPTVENEAEAKAGEKADEVRPSVWTDRPTPPASPPVKPLAIAEPLHPTEKTQSKHTLKAAPTSFKSLSKAPAAPTPTRSKTPSSARPSPAAAARMAAAIVKPQLTGHGQRSKTPSTPRPSLPGGKSHLTPSKSTPIRPQYTGPSAVSRPKTPSSGLFAPTAASLAKARNAQPPTPQPVKKVASGASDRLSKPTAASLSKARSAATSPTAQKAKTPARKVVPSVKKGIAPTKSDDTSTVVQEPEPITAHAFAESDESINGTSDVGKAEEEILTHVNEEPTGPIEDESNLSVASNTPSVHEDAELQPIATESASHIDEVSSNYVPSIQGDDIDALVTLLEPIGRPIVIASIPDEE